MLRARHAHGDERGKQSDTTLKVEVLVSYGHHAGKYGYELFRSAPFSAGSCLPKPLLLAKAAVLYALVSRSSAAA